MKDEPRLSPDVRLVGEQLDTGFRERQWLVERDGRFLQVSELLYRILERADGRHGIEEIARGATESTPWTVTPAHVREIVESKLAPAGLVTADENVRRVRRQPRSPLSVSARKVLLGPRALEPVTAALRFLYAPAVLVAVLGGLVAAHLWLYLGHGIGGPITDVLVHPALVLAATLIFIVTTMVHELGHASALRYGGGRTRGIGVGVYLVYPVFFTDTTDAYRLGRWARVRVDLGGFYFQLIAAAGLVGLATISGQEWLLFPVLVINFEALRQLLFPFVRLDGYWLFADLAGIPDFFSHVAPFVRSLLPGSLRRGSALPALRRATKGILLGYVVAVVPILGLLVHQLVTSAPRFFATAWSSFEAQRIGVAHALGTGDIAGAAGSLGQLLILATPALTTTLLTLVTVTWVANRLAGPRRER
jgi:putative peptide zinc metalloprotease protein